MNSTKIIAFLTFTIVIAPLARTAGQSGGGYVVEESVFSSGGGTLTGGNFVITSTKGQGLAGGQLSGAPYTITSGFWTFIPSVPTAAPVSISGRVLNSEGRGIVSAIVTLTSADGSLRAVRTSAFGRFRFENVGSGGTYIIGISARRFTFPQPTQILFVTDDIDDLSFTANP